MAQELFGLSRDVERAVTIARLSEVTWHLELDAGAGAEGLWAPLLGFSSDDGHRLLAQYEDPRPRDVRFYLTFDEENDNGLVSCIRRARGAAHGVRESISSEMWEQINRLYLSLADADLSHKAEQDATAFYRRARESLQFFQGLADATIAHDEAWHFICLGKFLERADNAAKLLALQAHLLTMGATPGRDESVRWLAVLRSCGAAEAYAHFYSLRVEPARVVEFVLLNPIFPQAVRFSLAAARDALQAIALVRSGGDGGGSPAVRAMGRLCARLEHIGVDEVFDEGLGAYLADVRSRIDVVVDEMTRRYLNAEPSPDRFAGVSRAVMIMAAQQQQQ